MTRLILCLTVLLQGCSSHAVRCDSHLQAINAPADKRAAAEKPTSAETPASVGKPAP
jgi:hypothetical protein